jgi:Tfp pilus assembly protein PilF
VSLLLDALRRAGAARGDDIAEPVNPRTAADDRASPPEGGDDDAFDLDPEAATAAEPESSARKGDGATGLQGPARAEAVFRGGTPGGSVIRTALLVTLGVIVLAGGLAFGGWYYYESTRNAVDRELIRYTPDPEPAAAPANDDAANPPGDTGIDPAALKPLASADRAGGDDVDPKSVTTAEDAEAAQSMAPEASTRDDDVTGTGDAVAESDRAPDSADRESNVGDAGIAAAAEAETGKTGAEPAATDAGEATARQPDAPENAEQTTAAATRQSGNGVSDVDVGAESESGTGDGPLVRRTADGGGRSPLAKALQSGYRALRSGDLMAARRHYREALELDASNRDARLGAAAVAQRQGNAAAAIEHYRQVLADHPRDPYARSGLASLEGTADPRRLESELKTLLKQDPDAHALRYALGNLYARENRWSQAQSEYFDAFRAAPKEADYAFNLAVALDQLGKRDAAMEYYDRALELAGDGSASFALEAARRRLESLRP